MKLHSLLGSLLPAGLLAGLLTGSLSGGVRTAAAEDALPLPGAPGPGSIRTYVPIDPSMADITSKEDAIAGGITSRIIFLNNCKPNGCVVRSGPESAINNTSSIISGTRTVQPFAFSDATWAQVVQCVRETYAPFNITITDQDPGNVSHWEAIVAGQPSNVGFQDGVGGVAPYNCGIINNAITYSFANIYGGSVRDICWTVAQETAHAWGLDHELLASDPLTYLQGWSPDGFKRFQNQNANCGEYNARQCQCGGSQQNSYQDVLSIFGSATPTPPAVTITEPANGARVEPGFIVRVNLVDDNGIASARLDIDNQAVLTLTSPPFVFNAPTTLGEGTHQVRISAIDGQGTEGSAVISVVIGEPCDSTSDCEAQGDGLVCVDGRCVAGSGVDGGLGTTCADDVDCTSGRCEHSNEGSFCVEECDPAADGCPSGFRCLTAGVCWPGGDDGSSVGCAATGRGDGDVPTLPIALGLGLAGLTAVRRRRR